jgi:hypothetical protein
MPISYSCLVNLHIEKHKGDNPENRRKSHTTNDKNVTRHTFKFIRHMGIIKDSLEET